MKGMSALAGEMTEGLRNEGGDDSGDAGLLKDFMNNLEE